MSKRLISSVTVILMLKYDGNSEECVSMNKRICGFVPAVIRCSSRFYIVRNALVKVVTKMIKGSDWVTVNWG